MQGLDFATRALTVGKPAPQCSLLGKVKAAASGRMVRYGKMFGRYLAMTILA